ncbi:unnamed protein product [Echinostoma caproni]|uniref:Reverse transcriptase domain-containing protein n=1 Tax=Echinostoma caproni TaxID=27848 RepID=A0A183B1G4_9TREM|nr:unnamed protein product [Echinostoma caproni]
MFRFGINHILNKVNIEGKQMTSFDVQFLFTNVPVREVIQITCDHVKEQIQLSLLVFVLERLLLFCTIDVSFSFHGNGYRQIDGGAMGNPKGSVLANLLIAHLELIVPGMLSGTKITSLRGILRASASAVQRLYDPVRDC